MLVQVKIVVMARILGVVREVVRGTWVLRLQTC